ncbi:hypothetical protein [Mucilaginibacter paludis]|uniref:Uncharacterized protein n=1 Tax=Mucilaginibacter paludis DSM 18603 TaxID=714943 RepID=H1YE23_9SPHI|nr:hypothetical protein [Mucilaginibacter paludis]EHQ25201.1 hypothetical protein Mucpa_1028 [Mucilaginibacter paludis DSM 18603]
MSNKEDELAAGTWSIYTCIIDEAAKLAFEEAMKGFVGVRHVPVAVSFQLKNGMNYKFFCNATPVVLHPNHFASIVCVYKPLNGPANLIHIFPIQT